MKSFLGGYFEMGYWYRMIQERYLIVEDVNQLDTVDMKPLVFPFFLHAEQRHSYLTCSMGICPITI